MKNPLSINPMAVPLKGNSPRAPDFKRTEVLFTLKTLAIIPIVRIVLRANPKIAAFTLKILSKGQNKLNSVVINKIKLG